MIARFRILLPFWFALPYGVKLDNVEFEYGEYKVKIYPPMPANTDSSVYEITSSIPIADAIDKLAPEMNFSAISGVMVNGDGVVKANLIQIDLTANRDFDRENDRPTNDPPIELFFQFLNDMLSKIRFVGRLVEIHAIDPRNCGWNLEFLSNGEEILPEDKSKHRGKFQTKILWQFSNLRPDTWKLASYLPNNFKPPIWDTLLLDAHSQMPNVNAAIVLAYSAIEAFINFALEIFAQNSSISPESWGWLISRDHWLKQPSTKEKYSNLLFLVTNRSLEKEEKELWNSFNQLRNVRNSIAHEGRAVIRKKTNKNKKIREIEVDNSMASEMITNAEKIIIWVESFLPEEFQRLFNTEKITTEWERLITMQEDAKMMITGIESNIKSPFELNIINTTDK